MTDETYAAWDRPDDDGVLDDADTLASQDMTGDPLDDAIDAGDRYSAGEGFGNTEAEARQGESLDQRLAEEQPEDDVEDPAWDANGDGDGDRYGRPDAEAGRLVADDEGAGPDRTSEEVAAVASGDTGGRTAEETAMHVRDGD